MTARTIKTIRHIIKLQGFDQENGQFSRPLFERTDLRRIAKAQNYQGYSAANVNDIVFRMQVEEPLNELLAALKK